jgi:E3 ubiquitin-protein ligase BRE1
VAFDMQTLEKALADRETEVKSLKEKTSFLENEIKQNSEAITVINRDLEAARTRCDDLSLETNAVIKDKSRALEDLKVTTKRMIDLRKSAARGNLDKEDASGSTTQFTAKQLTTQLEVLKGRLTCPVCNNRDKSCILTRCRHMFCRTCVDTNIKNRSRKCPACGIRFDTKDVAEIWL